MIDLSTKVVKRLVIKSIHNTPWGSVVSHFGTIGAGGTTACYGFAFK